MATLVSIYLVLLCAVIEIQKRLLRNSYILLADSKSSYLPAVQTQIFEYLTKKISSSYVCLILQYFLKRRPKGQSARQ